MKSNIRIAKILTLLFLGLCLLSLHAQSNKPDLYPPAQKVFIDELSFLSYDKVPTICGVAGNWQNSPIIYLYDYKKYKGHALFVQNYLHKCNSFKEFKKMVSNANERKFVPFFLYNLSSMPLNIEQQKYEWAVMVEDYNYTDSNAQIAALLMKLTRQIQTQIPAFKSKGLIVLTQNPANKINSQLAPILQQQGFASITLNNLKKYSGASEQQILNKGTAIGRLVMVNNLQQCQQLLSTDIAVFNYIPLEIPPVAGIITLFGQTPLSHTAILAKNRGTVNVYVSNFNTLGNYNNLIGQTVKLKAINNTIELSKTNEPIPQKQFLSIKIPEATEICGLKVIQLNNSAANYLTIESIGTKACNYAKLEQLLGNKFVKNGYAVGFSPYFNVVKQQALPYLQALLQNKNKVSKQEINLQLKNIRQCILESQVPSATLLSIKNLIKQKFPFQRIRLRSSTNCEDLAQFNGAGLYASQGLNPWDSDKKLQKAILRIYASLWSEKAFWERAHFNIEQQQVAMGLQINPAFENANEWANGVVITEPNNKKLKILINAQADSILVTNPTGNGEIPESFYVNPQKGTIEQINTKSSIKNIFIDMPNSALILKTLTSITQKIHTAFVSNKKGYGVDIEFKIMCNQTDSLSLFIKQARLLKM